MAMSWFVLVLSGVLEAVWATALGRSDGLTRPVPTATFVVALALSMGGHGYAMRTLPVGTSYAMWVGIGAVASDEVDDLVGELGTADDQVRQRRVVLVVDQRRAVDAAAVETGGAGDD